MDGLGVLDALILLEKAIEDITDEELLERIEMLEEREEYQDYAFLERQLLGE